MLIAKLSEEQAALKAAEEQAEAFVNEAKLVVDRLDLEGRHLRDSSEQVRT